MPTPVIIASADPLVAAALAEQLNEAGFACAQTADLAVLDADAPVAVQARRVLTLARNSASCPQPALAKPVRLADLVARLRRLEEYSGEHALADGWVLCPAERLLKREESTLELTEKEALLLVCLLEAPARTVHRQKLLEDVWGYKQGTDTHTLETHLHRLRAKLKDIGGEGWIVATDDGYRIAS